jgi:hypothetical protein
MKCIVIITLALISVVVARSDQTNVVHVTADNSIIDVKGERDFNMGAVSRIWLKAFQHHVILKFDTSALTNRIPTSASLVYYESNDNELDHVTISTIQADWREGASDRFAVSEGGSCFNYARYSAVEANRVPWTWPGSKFPEVVYGNAFSLVDYCDTHFGDDGASYYRWDFNPDLVAANVLGTSYGLAVFESSRIVSQNRTVYSKEHNLKPYLVITSVPNNITPAPITDLSASLAGVDRGELRLSWTAPVNAFAYRIKVDGVDIPRYLIPYAATAGAMEQVVIRDILTPGVEYLISVEALSRGGGASGLSSIRARASDISAIPGQNISQPNLRSSVANGYGNTLLRVWAVPETEKVLPDASLLEEDAIPVGYKTGNPVFDGRTIRLSAARNETVAFILGLEAVNEPVRGLRVSLNTDGQIAQRLARIAYINTARGFMPEVIYLLPATLATDMDENAASTQTVQQVLVEILVPKNTAPGAHALSLSITDGAALDIAIPVQLEVWNFTLKDFPSFKLEMNDYGYPNYLATFNQLQKLARQDRAHVNLAPYGKSRTRMDMYLPDGGQMNENAYNNIAPGATTTHWDDFVKAFDPAFTGSLYNSGLWQDAALPGFYLTFHESWPLDYAPYAVANELDAFKAFTRHPIYAQTFVNLLANFVTLAESRAWTEAGFQVYLNNKRHPWDFDEPYDFWDFKALAYYGSLFDLGTADNDEIDIRYRIDISRPQYHRKLLAGKVDLAVVSRALFTYPRLVRAEAERDGTEVWNYGTAPAVYTSNHNVQGWPLLAYAFGASGILPWSSVKYTSPAYPYLTGVTSGDYQQRALYIVASDSNTPRVYSTLRMKAFRRAAQDIEYLEQAKQASGLTHGQVQRMILETLGDGATVEINPNYVEDAGTLAFTGLSEADFMLLRQRAAKIILGQDAPVIQSITVSNKLVKLQFDNLYTNRACALEYSRRLIDPNWTTIINFLPVSHMHDWSGALSAGAAQSYFRLRFR